MRPSPSASARCPPSGSASASCPDAAAQARLDGGDRLARGAQHVAAVGLQFAEHRHRAHRAQPAQGTRDGTPDGGILSGRGGDQRFLGGGLRDLPQHLDRRHRDVVVEARKGRDQGNDHGPSAASQRAHDREVRLRAAVRSAGEDRTQVVEGEPAAELGDRRRRHLVGDVAARGERAQRAPGALASREEGRPKAEGGVRVVARPAQRPLGRIVRRGRVHERLERELADARQRIVPRDLRQPLLLGVRFLQPVSESDDTAHALDQSWRVLGPLAVQLRDQQAPGDGNGRVAAQRPAADSRQRERPRLRIQQRARDERLSAHVERLVEGLVAGLDRLRAARLLDPREQAVPLHRQSLLEAADDEPSDRADARGPRRLDPDAEASVASLDVRAVHRDVHEAERHPDLRHCLQPAGLPLPPPRRRRRAEHRQAREARQHDAADHDGVHRAKG